MSDVLTAQQHVSEAVCELAQADLDRFAVCPRVTSRELAQLVRMAQRALDYDEQKSKWAKDLRDEQDAHEATKRSLRKWIAGMREEQENTAERARVIANELDGDYARGRRDAVADMAHPCTCGSGGHPRECKRHVWAYQSHIDGLQMEIDRVNERVLEQRDELARKVKELEGRTK